MSENTLLGKIRLELGKGPSRRLRMQDELPAVLATIDRGSVAIVVPPKETTRILRGPLKRNIIVELELEGDTKKRAVMVKDRQIHPTRRVLTHVDFVEVDLKKPVTVAVPVILTGKSESVVLGGKLDHVLQKMRISCLPTSIPPAINIDISMLAFGLTHTKDVPLPEGITLAEKPRVVVLTIKKPRGAAKEEEGQAGGAGTQAKAPAAKASPAKGK